MTAFTFRTAPRIVSQIGGLAQLPALCADLGITRPLIVTDPGIVGCGIAERAMTALSHGGLTPALFDKVAADPPVAMVEAAVTFARQSQADGIIGLGGGSSLDTAKVVALLTRSTQGIGEIFGTDMAIGGRLPLIQVPTTAGTGSEVTWVSVVTNEAHEKKAIYTP